MFKKWNKNDKAVKIFALVVLGAVILAALFLAVTNISKFIAFVKGIFSTLLPFIYGFVFAYLCNPIYKKLYKHVFKFCERKNPHPKLRKGLSIFSAFVIFLGVIALILYAIIPQIIKAVNPSEIENYVRIFSDFTYQTIDQIGSTLNIDPDEIQKYFTEKINEVSSNFLAKIDVVSIITTLGKEIITQVFAIIVGLILSVYFLIYKESIVAKIKRFLCSVFKRNTYEKIIHFARYTDKTFGRYIIGAILDSILVGLVVFLILTIINFPFAPLIGVIVGVTNVIPFFGPFIGAIPSAVLILLGSISETGDGSQSLFRVLIFVIIILIVQQIDGNIIAPYIQGTATGLSPIGVIFAVTICNDLFGFIGMVIGVPLFAVITYAFSGMIEKRLKNKKLPVNISCYRARDIFTDEGFLKAKIAMEAQERANHNLAVKKAKAEKKITEQEILEVENRIVDEIISEAAEETVPKAEDEIKSESDITTAPIKNND